MAKYLINMIYSDGSEELIEDEVYDTYEAAEDMAVYYCGCTSLGKEILHMSNPGDYPYDEDEEDETDYEIIEIDD